MQNGHETGNYRLAISALPGRWSSPRMNGQALTGTWLTNFSLDLDGTGPRLSPFRLICRC